MGPGLQVTEGAELALVPVGEVPVGVGCVPSGCWLRVSHVGNSFCLPLRVVKMAYGHGCNKASDSEEREDRGLHCD